MESAIAIYGITDGQNRRSGDFWEQRLHPEDRADMIAYADKCRRENRDFMHDYRILHSSGEVRHIRSKARYVGTPDTGRKLIGVNIDITEDYRRTSELDRIRQRLEHDALHDALTGLRNRRSLDQCCRGAITQYLVWVHPF